MAKGKSINRQMIVHNILHIGEHETKQKTMGESDIPELGYVVFISQLIPHSRACVSYQN
jgi:hypothetical protein